ncbi:hypothetical protein ACFXOD_11665 [Streptomyces sp. NPDC059161]|uniref:hypothetical protein n=1 Tax=Streptomyces sp. NPDC059161 TaxID=3346749 RepID=UPI00369C53D2
MSTTRDAEARWRAFQARMDASAARRHAARVAESATRRQGAVEKAVQALRGLTETVAGQPQTEPSPAAPAPEAAPAKPLHQMNTLELRALSREYWGQRSEALGSPSWRGLE